MTKTITIAAIIGAFVLGSVSSLSMADASPANDALVAALDRITTAINGIDPNVTVEPTPVTVNVEPTPITIEATAGPAGPAGTTSWSGLTNIPAGFSDGIDNVNDGDTDPTNERQILVISKPVTITNIQANGFGMGITDCPSDTVVIGGGFDARSSSSAGTFNAKVVVKLNQPRGNSWQVTVENPNSFPIDQFGVTAICAKLI